MDLKTFTAQIELMHQEALRQSVYRTKTSGSTRSMADVRAHLIKYSNY